MRISTMSSCLAGAMVLLSTSSATAETDVTDGVVVVGSTAQDSRRVRVYLHENRVYVDRRDLHLIGYGAPSPLDEQKRSLPARQMDWLEDVEVETYRPPTRLPHRIRAKFVGGGLFSFGAAWALDRFFFGSESLDATNFSVVSVENFQGAVDQSAGAHEAANAKPIPERSDQAHSQEQE